jgi:hypothetical protein
MRFILFAITFLSVFSCRTAASGQHKPDLPGNSSSSNLENTIRITGIVQVYGNEPHTFVGIVEENGTEYAVYPPSQEAELRKLQGHLIAFTVIMLDEPKGEGGIYLKGGTVTPLSWEILR